MNKLKIVAVIAFLTVFPAVAHCESILWGYEKWKDDGTGQVSEWERYNMNFVPNRAKPDGNQTATARTLGNDSWGKVFYLTGKSSESLKTYRYLYINFYDIQGDVMVAISGAYGADYYEVTPYVVSGNKDNPKVIYNPGQYVFDLSGWSPTTSQDNVIVYIIAEEGSGKGFEVNRIFISDYNPLASFKRK